MGSNILLVESNLMVAETYADFLREKGNTVTTEPFGDHVLFRLKSLKPDLLIINLALERMSGIDVLDTIAKDEDIPKIPVILLTESSKIAELEQAGKLGAIEYFNNTTVDAAALCAKVDEVLTK